MYRSNLAGCLLAVLTLFSASLLAKSGSATNNSSSVRVSSNKIPHLSAVMTIDGELSEGIWKDALIVSLNYEIDPGENIQAKVQTKAYIFENGDYLYVAFDAFDDQPEKIRAYLSDRDDLWNSDYVGIALDTFNDSRRAYQFYTNAIGVQADSIIDEVTSRNDVGWDSIWKSAGKLNEKGYTVEMAIPLKSLRFEASNEVKQWKFRLSRIWTRDVMHEFSNVTDDRNNDCSLCQFDSLTGLKETTATRNVTIIPAVTYSQTDRRPPIPNASWDNGNLLDRESLDVRWGITPNTFLNATLNPDFSQVEADSVQLETNKRFAVFTQEKRAFFLDGADYFSNWSRLVYTKLFAEPEYGVKVTGKSGAHSYGVMSIKDKDTNFLLTDSQSSRLVRLLDNESDNQIFRYRYDLSGKGNVGMTYTNRNGQDYSNQMMSFDGKYWFGASDYFKFQVMDSTTLNPLEVQQNYTQDREESGNAFSLNYSHATRDWSFYLTHHQFGKNFRADSGFVSKSNWRSSAVEINRQWYPAQQSSWWKNVSLDLQWNGISDMEGNQLDNKFGIGLDVNAIYQSNFGFVFFKDKQNFVEQSFPSSVDPNLFLKEYDVSTAEVFYDVTPLAGLDLSVTVDFGDAIDFSTAELGKVITIIPSVNYQVNDNWKFTLDYLNESLKVNGSTVYDIDIFNMRTAYQIDVNSFLRLTLQALKDGSDQGLASQLLYSYQLNPYTLFFLGYSDDAFKDQTVTRYQRTDKTLFVKFSYAWQL